MCLVRGGGAEQDVVGESLGVGDEALREGDGVSVGTDCTVVLLAPHRVAQPAVQLLVLRSESRRDRFVDKAAGDEGLSHAQVGP